MKNLVIGASVLAGLAVVAAHFGRAEAKAAPVLPMMMLTGGDPTNYNGNQTAMGFTEDPDSSDDSVTTGMMKNNTGEEICDFTVGPAPGATATGGIKSITVQTFNGTSPTTNGGSFHFDDNGDGDVSDSGEDNGSDDDSSFASSAHSISEPEGKCIPKNGNFKITVTKEDGASVDMQWQGTSNGASDGEKGGLMAAVILGPKGVGNVVMVNNNFGVKTVHQGAVNVDPNSVTSIHLTPPSGVAIQDVWSDNHPGSFNSMTNVFTFSTAVPAGQFYSFEWEFDDFSLGLPETMFEWEAN